MINLLLFADKTKIFGYDLTDRTSPSELSFEGNDSVSFENDTAVKDCIQCIKDKYSVDDLSDDDFDIAVIDCGTKKKYIPEIVNAVQKSRKIGVYSLNKLIVPALINMSKQPEDTIYVSLGDYTYKVYSLDGVYYTDNAKCDEPDIQLNISDLSFVFNFNKPEAAVQTGATPSQIAELNSEIAKLNNKISESEQTIVALRNENAAVTEKEAEEPQELPADEYVDNAELKTKLKEIMNADFPLDDYLINVQNWNGKNLYTICCTKSEQMYSFPINSSEDQERIDSIVKNALVCLYEHYKILSSKYAKLKRGEIFEFGTYKNTPIKWRVLDKDNGILKVISDGIIFKHEFDTYRATDDKWENSSLYELLNGVFYRNSFSDIEKQLIYNDKISILSRDEISKLFSDDEERIVHNCLYWTSDISCQMAYYVNSGGYYKDYTEQTNILGVRPYLEIKYL